MLSLQAQGTLALPSPSPSPSPIPTGSGEMLVFSCSEGVKIEGRWGSLSNVKSQGPEFETSQNPLCSTHCLS